MAQKFTVPITVKQLSSAGSDAITLYVDTETYSRLKIEAGGRLTWGSGSANGDVNLYRDGADVLRTDDTFKTPTLFVDNIEIDTTGAQTDYILKFDGTKFTAASVTFGGGGFEVTTLDSLTDVTISSSTPGDFLKWNGTAWVNDPIDLGTDTVGNYMSGVSAGTGISVTHTPGEGSTATIGLNATLDNLSNVTVPTPSTNDVLQYNGSAWVNTAASSVGATNLDGLTDVIITAPEEFQTLEYNGTNWVNQHASVVSYVRNAETTTITTGTCVYLFGSTGDHATVKRADNTTDTTSSKTVGVAGANIAASQNGPVITRGYVDGIDLSVGYTAGDVLWLGKNGAFTTTKPTAPDHLVFIGVVVRATNNGIIYVATQNGYELDELHNVAASSPSPGDFLKYNGSLWVNDPINLGTDTVGNYVSSITAGTGIAVNFTPGEDAGASVSLSATLDQLSDVNAPSPASGDFLRWNGTAWINDAIDLATDTIGNYVSSITAGPGISVNFTPSENAGASVSLNATLDQLSDVTASSPATGDFLKWNGSAWVNDDVDLGTDTTGDYVASVGVSGTGLSVSGTGEGAAVTVTSNATDTNTASTLVARDSSGNFSAGTITASLSGNASTASTLQTARTISFGGDLSGSASFNGGADITINATIAPNSVALGTDTTGNYVSSVTAGTGISVNFTPSEGAGASVSLNATLDQLTDVSTVGATANDVLTYNGSSWIAASVAAGGANVTSSSTPPASPNAGDLWLDSVNVDLYIYYDNHWVQLTGEEPLVEDLNDLADVDITSVDVGQFLKWNGTNWVPDTIVGGATTSTTPPASPAIGQLWFDTDDARTYVYYDGYWVEVGASGMAATVSDSAPSSPISGQIWYKSDTGGTYVYYGSSWVEVGAAPATFPTGKAIAMSIVFGG